MSEEAIHALDADALALFAGKGTEGGPGVPQAGLANGVKVRRVMQLTADLSRKPFEALRILDLGCGEGVYAIEAALRGAAVLALDARKARMDRGAAVAARLGLERLRFVQEDARRVSREHLGGFDVVYLLGLLYHLEESQVFAFLESVSGLCDRLLIVDTLVTLAPDTTMRWRGSDYAGARVREHGDADTPEQRESRLLKSIDNTFSFHFAKPDLLRALRVAGFTSILEAQAPFEPGKAANRVTLAALRGRPVRLSTYPWVNDRSEAEIAGCLAAATQAWRAAWRPGPPVRPLTADCLAGEALVLGLHGPGHGQLKRSHHDDVPGDPHYLWSGRCDGAWAASFRLRAGLLDLTHGSALRWRSRQSGGNRLHPVLETAGGEWFIADECEGASDSWRESALDPLGATWRPLDIATISVTGGPVLPDLARIRAFGIADPAPGSGSDGCSRLDWMEAQGVCNPGP